ncbi:MAG: nucleotidyltransferase domain-containing protein [Clostridia bacterium]|nr:nucleotidyltransferase domain-containing protein [Clostridia bacterium]MBR0406409.1 nucleotidyltransferase domain-containing protein [Clostridia bacterium]
MSEKIYTLDEIKRIASPIAARHGVAALYLFGSYARGDATSQSDLDFRIEKGKIRTLYQLAGFEMEMEESFDKHLDVLTTQMLSEKFMQSIQPEEVLIYAEN